LFPLFQELDFGRLTAARPIEVDGKSYPVSHGWGPVPIHLVGTHVDLDRRTPGAVGAAKASPHSLVQQVLNASDNHLWGIISNGYTLRLVRDNVALTRIAYLEWDLQAIFDGDLYPEFFLLWLVCHQSRFETPPKGRPDQRWIEKWKKQAEEKGLRALENLRPGVEKAIASIGSGLVSHKANQTLRSKLSSGQLTTQDFYRQILRIIYRMLFLFVAEDRGLLHPPLPGDDAGKDAIGAALKTRQRYRDFYSIGRLREVTLHRAGTPHPDLWQVFQLISHYLGSDSGCPELALPALGSFLWSPQASPDLNDCLISNRHFLEAVLALGFIRDGNVRRAIDYKNLGSEELGSVYESLLELHPVVNADSGAFELKTVAGHERKTSGSYYTHDSLVQSLLDTALEPVIAETIKGKEGTAAAEALLNLKICDLAVGSGHFLIGAAHRLARRVAAARTGEEEPSPEATRSALREVIGRCLYGVDINPMAAELCRVSLWLEALEPGKPLSFLDHHIRVGNSLLGATPELIAGGLPDEAFTPIEGDDRKFCSALKKKNKEERTGQRSMLHMMVAESKAQYNSIEASTRWIDEAPDDTIHQIHRKAEQFNRLVVSPEYRHAQQVADAWCAAFVWMKRKGAPFEPLTTDTIRRLEEDPNALSPGQKDEVERLAAQYRFFHWHLAFPEVFARGGFDCVLGNPPWEQIQVEAHQFFASRRPALLKLKRSDRQKAIALLESEEPQLFAEWHSQRRFDLCTTAYLKTSALYPLSTEKNVNSYAVFLELSLNAIKNHGRAGLVLQSGIATDDIMKPLFQSLVSNGRLVRFYDFENRQKLFEDIDSRMKFCLITVAGIDGACQQADFVFFAETLGDLAEKERHFTLNAAEIALLNPNTRTCPIFRSQHAALLCLNIYNRFPVLVRETPPEHNNWRVSIRRMFDMTYDSHLFQTSAQLPDCIEAGAAGAIDPDTRWLVLYEAKFIHQFDHRFATFTDAVDGDDTNTVSAALKADPTITVVPRYWVRSSDFEKKMEGTGWRHSWIIAFRMITNTTNERTAIATVVPISGIGNSCYTLTFDANCGQMLTCLVANANSFLFDWLTRQKLAGTNLNVFILKQLPLITPEAYAQQNPWSNGGQKLRDWLLPRVLELTYTAWDLEAFARDCGWSGPPFRWDEQRRFFLRCELDAAFFHLYLQATADGQWKPARVAEGAVRDEAPEELAELKRHFPTPRDAADYIMDTFPIIERKDEEKHGEYRTKRAILEIYDEMAEAMRSGIPYKIRLDPPPGPPADDHGNFLPLPEWKPDQPKPPNWPSHIHLPKGYKT
jgi:hypothetical protein